MMDDIFKDEVHEGWIIIYMDGIFIFMKELADNIKYTQQMLQKLLENDLYCKPEKCLFWEPKAEYLGVIIQENKIAMDPVKLEGICLWGPPRTVSQL